MLSFALSCAVDKLSFKWKKVTVFRFSFLWHMTVQVQLTWNSRKQASLLWLLSHVKKRDGKLQEYYIWCFLLLKIIWAQKIRNNPATHRTSYMNFKVNIHFQIHWTSWRLLKCQHAGEVAGRNLFISDSTVKELVFQWGSYCPFLRCSFKGREREWMQRI